MDLKKLHKKATESAHTFVHAIKEADWNKQSTCTEWTIRQLVNHLVNENLWVIPLLDGKTVAQVGNKFDGDLLGNNPIAAWDTTSAHAQKAAKD